LREFDREEEIEIEEERYYSTQLITDYRLKYIAVTVV